MRLCTNMSLITKNLFETLHFVKLTYSYSQRHSFLNKCERINVQRYRHFFKRKTWKISKDYVKKGK